MNKRPNSVANLNRALYRISDTDADFVANRDYFASLVVAQILDGCVIKGGASLKIRYGSVNTRYTNDLDTALSVSSEEFLKNLKENFQKGWCGFTGTITEKEKAHPKGINTEYVMQPYEIKLLYLNKPFCTVRLETTHDEIGNADAADNVVPEHAKELFNNLGFDAPTKLPLMSLSFQIAQKLHGLTEPDSRRIHDLVDLQIIFNNSDIDYKELKLVCERLFKYRNMQLWPPTINKNDIWESPYAAYVEDLDIIDNLEDAIAWCEEVIEKINDFPTLNNKVLNALDEAKVIADDPNVKGYDSIKELNAALEED